MGKAKKMKIESEMETRYGTLIMDNGRGSKVFLISKERLWLDCMIKSRPNTWCCGVLIFRNEKTHQIYQVPVFRKKLFSGSFCFFTTNKIDANSIANLWAEIHVRYEGFTPCTSQIPPSCVMNHPAYFAFVKRSIEILSDDIYSSAPFLFSHYIANVQNYELQLLIGYNDQAYIRQSKWNSIPKSLKKHFTNLAYDGRVVSQITASPPKREENPTSNSNKNGQSSAKAAPDNTVNTANNKQVYVRDPLNPEIKQKQPIRQVQKPTLHIKISDPNCIQVIIQEDNIRCMCSELAQFTDGNNSWTIPCRKLPQYDSIQVPATLFLDTVPEKAIKQMLQNNRLTDVRNKLPDSFFQKESVTAPVNEEQPSIETVPDSVAASYFSEAFISQAEQQAPAMWKLWQKSRQIFIFEEELCSSLLLNVNSIKTVCCETIRSIPYAAGYIIGGASDLEFFASMVGTTLKLQRMQGNQAAEAYTLELTEGCTVQECLPTIADKTKMARLLEMLQLYACLCVAEAAAAEPSPVATQSTAKPKKQGKAPAAAPDPAPIWDSIYTVTMRRTSPAGNPREEAAPVGPARRPHTRRAHWHNFWKGAKSAPESRWLERKWVAEIAVNAAQKELPVRIVLIKQSSYVNLIQNKTQRG